jgi:hypothetical protein
MSDKAYAVSSGDYSDYSVSCIFEDEDDATTYATARNEHHARRGHETMMQMKDRPHEEHTEPFETCEAFGCRYFRDNPLGDGTEYRVETFDFYAKGKVPLAEVR